MKKHEIELAIKSISDESYKENLLELFDFYNINIKTLIFKDRNQTNLIVENIRFKTENINDYKIWEWLLKILNKKSIDGLELDDSMNFVDSIKKLKILVKSGKSTLKL
ncbi:hypothetical protein [Spiroplasma endosymbiont of Labia minor]|uniref:hypothetical protein n=1 Tax=Spiroplasma endosymbiont of Labia minor TaxID=3066305 RepID=UPI0030CBF6B2